MTDDGVPLMQTTPPANRLRNSLIALTAIVLAAVLFLGLRGQTQTPSLATLAKASVPLEAALGNEQPTVLEFYADWCTSCQAMADDVAVLKQQYPDVNFVMLNVDNPKWLPEISRFDVDGIPHFVFLNRSSEVLANAIGQLPRTVLAADLEALSTDRSLPEQGSLGEVSSFTPDTRSRGDDDPRSHGGLPVS